MKLSFIIPFIIFTENMVYSYKYYMLALQKWCSDDYMIHGLWPQENVSYYPEYCENVIYKKPDDKLLQDMNNYWISCDNSNLWEHEWIKHGSCIVQQYNITENFYYSKTINLFKTYRNRTKLCVSSDCILGCFDLNYNLIKCD